MRDDPLYEVRHCITYSMLYVRNVDKGIHYLMVPHRVLLNLKIHMKIVYFPSHFTPLRSITFRWIKVYSRTLYFIPHGTFIPLSSWETKNFQLEFPGHHFVSKGFPPEKDCRFHKNGLKKNKPLCQKIWIVKDFFRNYCLLRKTNHLKSVFTFNVSKFKIHYFNSE